MCVCVCVCVCVFVDKIDFIRDVTAYILVVCLVVGVAYDGLVSSNLTSSSSFCSIK